LPPTIVPVPPSEYISPLQTNRWPFVLWLVLLVIALLFLVAIFGAPLAMANGHPAIGLTAYQSLSPLCHQLPERSFFIAGHKLAVCSRCTGIYVGFAAAALFYPLVGSLRRTETPNRIWLILAAIPLAIDFALGYFEIWENTHWSRFATGALLGSVAVFFVVPGLVDLGLRKAKKPGRPLLEPEQFASAPSDYSAPHRRI
jgi:uncharacterized membrane protein